jgi:Tol biopolymer transport system component
MKKILYLIALLVFQVLLFPQQKSIKLFGDENDPCLGPTLSPNGKFIAFSKSNYVGIYIFDIEKKSITQITNEVASGYGIQWSSDSRYILSRPAYYEDRIRYNAVKIYDIQTGTVTQLTDYRTKMPSMPAWSPSNDEVIIASKGNVEAFDSKIQVQPEFSKAKNDNVIFLIDDKIAVKNSSNGEVKIYEPIKGKKCMNLAVSPDNQRVVFEIYGGDLYSMKTDGTELTNLGKGYRGKWLKDSETIVYMICEDDGHTFTYSDIFSIKYDGTNKKNLTNTSDKHEMSPSASFSDNTIVFEVLNEGSIYMMKLD